MYRPIGIDCENIKRDLGVATTFILVRRATAIFIKMCDIASLDKSWRVQVMTPEE